MGCIAGILPAVQTCLTNPPPRCRPTLITCGCGLVPGLVTGLNLTFNNLSGSFPNSLNALFPTRGTLQSLMLSRNSLTSECAPLKLAPGCWGAAVSC